MKLCETQMYISLKMDFKHVKSYPIHLSNELVNLSVQLSKQYTVLKHNFNARFFVLGTTSSIMAWSHF